MQTEKKVPERRCIGCGEHRAKSELLRIVRLPDGRVETDAGGKKPGRGAYVCFDEKCFAKGMKRLSRSLSAETGGALREEISEIISNHRGAYHG